MVPSKIFIIRFARAQTEGSWVIRITVRPSLLSDSKISRTSFPVFESRAPVGSSASKTDGEVTIARAMATRCCCPQESWVGTLSYFSVSPIRSRACLASCSFSFVDIH